MSEPIPAYMTLAKTVEEFFGELDWTFDWEWQNKPHDILFKSGVQAEGQSFPLFVETSESAETMALFIYSPFDIPVPRIQEIVKLINRLNIRMPLGRYAIVDNGEPVRIQWKGMIDVEGATLSAKQVRTIQQCGFDLFERDIESFTRLAFSKCTADEIWDEMLENQSKPSPEDCSKGESIPEQL